MSRLCTFQDDLPLLRTSKIRHVGFPVEYEMERFLQGVFEQHNSWSAHIPIAEWHGIEVGKGSKASAVLEVNWRSQRIRGIPQWSLLPKSVRKLDVGSNSLTGEIDLAAFPREMRHLYLCYNEFHGHIDLNACPPELLHLYLNHNHFSGPVRLASLPSNIQFLHLGSNRFGGIADVEHLPVTLITLDLTHNGFRGFAPEDIPDNVRVGHQIVA
mmetsp:Transcript_8553/g.11548  ORF Transcript_8553/g.11548 Transcript_8553/m.11548 type:complete len:213 (+) Transcript_8553:14-652(+)